LVEVDQRCGGTKSILTEVNIAAVAADLVVVKSDHQIASRRDSIEHSQDCSFFSEK
jgi:hypothetical protein